MSEDGVTIAPHAFEAGPTERGREDPFRCRHCGEPQGPEHWPTPTPEEGLAAVNETIERLGLEVPGEDAGWSYRWVFDRDDENAGALIYRTHVRVTLEPA